jgi:hypothetical protein
MAKKLGPVQETPPVDPFKGQVPAGLGVVPQHPVVGHEPPRAQIGPVVEENKVVVSVAQPKTDVVGRVEENIVTIVPPPEEPPFIGVVPPEEAVVVSLQKTEKPSIGPVNDAVVVNAPYLENKIDEEPKNVITVAPKIEPKVSQPTVVSPFEKPDGE